MQPTGRRILPQGSVMNRAITRQRLTGVAAAVAAAAVAVPVGLTTVAVPTAAAPAAASAAAPVLAPDAASARRHARARVAHRMLSAADLGAGWSAVDVDGLIAQKKGQALAFLKDVTVTPASCFAGLAIPPGYESESHRVFRKGTNQYGPYLGEVVAKFGSPEQARAALRWAKNKVEECQDLTIATSVGSVTVSIRRAGARAVSRAATGYRIDGSLGGFLSAGGQVFVAQKRRKIVIVGQGGVGQSSAARLGLTRRVAATAFDLI